MLEKFGYPDKELIKTRFPEKDILVKPKAITECYEAIPCNPCSTSCPFDAISIGEDINTPPVVDFDKCTGCGICVYNCPGLAIFTVVELENHLRYKIPYEFLPLPNEGSIVEGVNRKGEVICNVLIEKVIQSKRQDKTTILQVLVDKEHMYDFITIRRMTNG